MFNHQSNEPDASEPEAGERNGAGASEEPVAQEIAATESATRRTQADNQIKNHILAATTLGLVPVPLFDLALLIGNQVTMVRGLARLYGVPFDQVRTRAIILSLLAGSAPVLGVVGLSHGAKLMPGIGTLLGSGTVAVTGGALTYATGQAFKRHFEGGGDLFDIDLPALRRVFQRAFKEGKAATAQAQADDAQKAA